MEVILDEKKDREVKGDRHSTTSLCLSFTSFR